MPRDKTESHARIISAAKQEFLNMGYEKASMKAVAGRAGLTPAGLYRHFKDKEAMFASLVEPALVALRQLVDTQTRRAYQLLEAGDLENMWNNDTDLTRMLVLVYDHFDAFKLLLCASAGTRFENFFESFVELDQRETLRYLDALRAAGIAVNEVVPQELHLLLSAYYSAFFEIVIHDFSLQNAAHYLETLQTFFYPGWRRFLGF